MAQEHVTRRVNNSIAPISSQCLTGPGPIIVANLTELQTALTAQLAVITAQIAQATAHP